MPPKIPVQVTLKASHTMQSPGADGQPEDATMQDVADANHLHVYTGAASGSETNTQLGYAEGQVYENANRQFCVVGNIKNNIETRSSSAFASTFMAKLKGSQFLKAVDTSHVQSQLCQAVEKFGERFWGPLFALASIVSNAPVDLDSKAAKVERKALEMREREQRLHLSSFQGDREIALRHDQKDQHFLEMIKSECYKAMTEDVPYEVTIDLTYSPFMDMSCVLGVPAFESQVLQVALQNIKGNSALSNLYKMMAGRIIQYKRLRCKNDEDLNDFNKWLKANKITARKAGYYRVITGLFLCIPNIIFVPHLQDVCDCASKITARILRERLSTVQGGVSLDTLLRTPLRQITVTFKTDEGETQQTFPSVEGLPTAVLSKYIGKHKSLFYDDATFEEFVGAMAPWHDEKPSHLESKFQFYGTELDDVQRQAVAGLSQLKTSTEEGEELGEPFVHMRQDEMGSAYLLHEIPLNCQVYFNGQKVGGIMTSAWSNFEIGNLYIGLCNVTGYNLHVDVTRQFKVQYDIFQDEHLQLGQNLIMCLMTLH